METNKTLKFKTNINCGGCIAKVTPFLNGAKGIGNWEVDTDNRNKVLTVVSDGITENEVIDVVQKAGFKIEHID
jgi:copper chaperone